MAVPRLTVKELEQRFTRTGKTSLVALRSMDHMLPAQKGWKGKFASKMLPTRSRPNQSYVQPKDRIRFWNIVPGDVVRYRTGPLIAKEGSSELWRGQATVKQIDRTRNLAWLSNVDNPGQNPATNERRIVPRQMGEEGKATTFSNNTQQINRPVHVSNLQLLLPEEMRLPEGCPISREDLKEGRVATRMQGRGVRWNKRSHQYMWKRFAIVKARDGTNVKLRVPWPKTPNPTRPPPLPPLCTPGDVVRAESWIPWYPTDPIHISKHVARASPQSLRALHAQQAIRKTQPRVLRKPGYAPYIPIRQGPPAVLQPPTPADAIAMRGAEQRKWINDISDLSGQKSFASSDYHNMIPMDGPIASAAQWRTIPDKTPFQAGDRNERGIRLGAAGKDEMDAWPLELLMARELSPPKSLAKRTKRFHISKLNKQAELKKQEEIMAKNLEALRNIEL